MSRFNPNMIFLLCLLVTAVAEAAADDQSASEKQMTFRVTGLFSPDREADLKEVMKELPEIALVRVDFKTSEAVFQFVSAQAFPGAKPEQIVERFDNRLRTLTRGTFGIREVCSIPRGKLKFVEILIAGLDCKGCSLAAYETVYRLEGVEQATASFRDGLVTAWINPEKTSRDVLEEALRKRNIPAPVDPEK